MKKYNSYYRFFGGGIFLFLPGIAFGQGTVTAIQMLENLSSVYPAVTQLITAFCYLAGFALVMRGIFYLKMYGELRTMMSTQTSIKIPITLIFVGAFLIFLPSGYNVMSVSFFGSDSVLRYDQVTTSMNPMLLKAIVGLIRIIGLISFIKGWMILIAHAQQPGGQATLGRAVTHIIGGLCAYNILSFANIVWTTLYGSNLFS